MNSYFGIVKNIRLTEQEAINKARKRLDILAKPIGSLGILEDIAAKVSGMTGKVQNKINKKMFDNIYIKH
jgi:nicotinate-nucleotide--dimethylbenzimidazole phosphoribosyltransferase